MFSVLYVADNDLYQIGPFASEEEANKAARKAQDEGEFDIEDTNVYLFGPDHRLIPYSMDELTGGD
jgi:hypothetical protein